jgi:hypothetical protein
MKSPLPPPPPLPLLPLLLLLLLLLWLLLLVLLLRLLLLSLLLLPSTPRTWTSDKQIRCVLLGHTCRRSCSCDDNHPFDDLACHKHCNQEIVLRG